MKGSKEDYMTYYERLRHEPSAYDSPEDRMDRFIRIQRKTEFDIEKEIYELEQIKEEEEENNG